MRWNRNGFGIRRGDEALSAVLAVVLLLAVTVVLAGTVYVWAGGFEGGGPNGGPSLALSKRVVTSREAKIQVDTVADGVNWADLALRLDGEETQGFDPDCAAPVEGAVETGQTFCVTGLNMEGRVLTVMHNPSEATLTTITL